MLTRSKAAFEMTRSRHRIDIRGTTLSDNIRKINDIFAKDFTLMLKQNPKFYQHFIRRHCRNRRII
jgi:hypothetical protein